MIDATRILDMLIGNGGIAGPDPQSGRLPGPYAAPPSPQPHSQPHPEPVAGGPNDLIDRARGVLAGLVGSAPQGFGGGVAGGVAAGAVTSLLLGSKAGRELAGEALKLGAAAALGGLAWRAYANYQAGQPVGAPLPPSLPSAVPPAPAAPASAAEAESAHALLLVRAMIAAALSDGVLDDAERSAIIGRLAAAGISSDERRFLDAEIARPLSPAELAAAAPAPERRAEVYLAASLAIDANTDAERAYLKCLAATLGLDEALIAHLEAAVRSARGGQPALAAAS